MNEEINFILVANGAGEVAGYVKPLAAALFESIPRSKIILALSPCQYATKNEAKVAQSFGSISQIIEPAVLRKWLLLNQTPPHINLAEKGAVIFLGGDLMWAALLARKAKYPAFAYLGDHLGWTKTFKKYFVATEPAFQKFENRVPLGKLELVGNLMVDSVQRRNNLPKPWEIKHQICQRLMLDPKKPIISLFPGSRDFSLDYLIPFYQKTAEILRKESPQVQVVLSLSPFVDKTKLQKYLNRYRVDLPYSEEAELIADVAITIPGTNTAQLGAMGLPMIVIFPLDRPDQIPLEGLADLIGKIPFLGVLFKKALAAYINSKVKYFSLPNKLANQTIITELRGKIEPRNLAIQALALLGDPLRRTEMSMKLKAAMGEPGAAVKIVQAIKQELGLSPKGEAI